MTGGHRGSIDDLPKLSDFPDDFEPEADAVAFVALGVALLRCFRLAILPEQLAVITGSGRFDPPSERLDALVKQILSDIQSMPEMGFPGTQQTPGQKTAIRAIEFIADELREELAESRPAHPVFRTIREFPAVIRKRLRRKTKSW